MRICLVSETWAPEINGVAHTLGRLADELMARGHELQLIRPRPDDGQCQAGLQAELQVRGLPLPGYRQVRLGWPAGRAIHRFWHQQRPDVTYLATEGPLGWAALSAARRLTIPSASGFHTDFDHYAGAYGMGLLKPLVRAGLRRFHNRTGATLVPTPEQASRLADQGFANLAVMGRGVDTRRFTPDKRDTALRLAWGAQPQQPVVLHVGRLAKEKNLALLVRTIRAMQAQRPDLVQVIVGDGPQRQALTAQLPEAHFCGFVSPADLPRYYASADLLLFPSLSETYGNVVTEAMASGLPVVAFATAAAALLIESGRNGLAVEPGDDEAFVDAAVSLCQSPARWGQLGRAARLTVAEQSWSRIADDFLAILEGVQGTRALPAHRAPTSVR
ncbi:glycosyltransferase family 4 protein [Halomonas sp. 328]|uniref:glycosyltransferase family 4 protein n=1 Tax=Halomonas sp. 328 TaxID=2776704 RepID=UPI0018A73128|nr:glycosyltransferase family 1 protein [Halomonas sp. 328]MBF8222074.1 glycosyltransferase family 1 protein [Halomonas sp. 328]